MSVKLASNMQLYAILTTFLLLESRPVNCDCSRPLLDQAQLSASSEISQDRSAKHAILHGGSSWTAGQSDFGQYLIVDLGEKKNITSVAVQGKPYTAEYVQEYRLDYGNDGQDFASYRDRHGNIKARPHGQLSGAIFCNTWTLTWGQCIISRPLLLKASPAPMNMLLSIAYCKVLTAFTGACIILMMAMSRLITND
ncbi:Neurexin-4 [Halotydeus destructor]|nr:Neurexin-4 [Halotydeus destructor]